MKLAEEAHVSPEEVPKKDEKPKESAHSLFHGRVLDLWVTEIDLQSAELRESHVERSSIRLGLEVYGPEEATRSATLACLLEHYLILLSSIYKHSVRSLLNLQEVASAYRPILREHERGNTKVSLSKTISQSEVEV